MSTTCAPLSGPCPASLSGLSIRPLYPAPVSDRSAARARACTVALDFLSFGWAAVFYQLVVASAHSLADITDADRRCVCVCAAVGVLT